MRGDEGNLGLTNVNGHGYVMHVPVASALCNRDCYWIVQVHRIKTRASKVCSKGFIADPALARLKCTIPYLNFHHVTAFEASGWL